MKSLSPLNSIVASWSWYSRQQLANLPLVRIREDAHRNHLMQNEKRKNLTILIVGETSRAENFSLNGYPRETDPRLAKDNVVSPLIPHLAARQRQFQYRACSRICRVSIKEELAQQEGVLDIISERASTCCGMTTMAAVKVPATACLAERHRAESAWSVHQQQCCRVLFHGLEEYINNLQGDGVIVLHTIGSHSTTY